MSNRFARSIGILIVGENVFGEVCHILFLQEEYAFVQHCEGSVFTCLRLHLLTPNFTLSFLKWGQEMFVKLYIFVFENIRCM